ncbi:MAG: hypothetical protein ABII97_02775 [Patescibacteria group bacterium]
MTHLKKSGIKVVLFFYDIRNTGLPESLRREFESDQVVVESVRSVSSGRFYRKFSFFNSLFAYNKARRRRRYIIRGWSKTLLFFEQLLFGFLNKLHFLKTFARYLEGNFFVDNFYAVYFDKYKPDVVFSTSIISKLDIDFLKEAKKRKIKTVAMPKVWDNITHVLYKVIPDKLILQNDLMKEGAINYQRIKNPEIISVCGFPQFDWYRRKDVLMSREDYFKSIGLDPNKKLILWGSSGVFTPDDAHIPKILVEAIKSGKILNGAVSLLIRAHFTDAKDKRFDCFKGIENVQIDDNLALSEFFHDRCDPREDEIKRFVNMIYHSDVVVCLCSTLTLDAFCVDKPVVNTVFKSLYDKNGKDISHILYEWDHYEPIIKEKAVDMVYSEEEFFKGLNDCLQYPERKKEARQRVLDTLCYKVDGQSSKRIANEILEML